MCEAVRNTLAVDGRYDIRVRLTDEPVAAVISLTQSGERVFTASVESFLTQATPRRTLAAVMAHPVPSQRVSALIRWHGVRLRLRRLPAIPRPPHPPQAVPELSGATA